jgi:Domain of unknown function (DUF1932)
VARADVVVSICPPAAAHDLARTVAAAGFSGLYLDANAIAPGTAAAIAAVVGDAGATYVDGSVIGPPPSPNSPSSLYLSGAKAEEIAGLFAGPSLSVRILGDDPTRASALKMAYAAWSKGSQALLLAARAAAREWDVEDDLVAAWGGPDSPDGLRSERSAGGAGRAWRWAGEMEQISQAFRTVGLPGGFHDGAADVFTRLEGFKDRPAVPLDTLLDALGTEPPRDG